MHPAILRACACLPANPFLGSRVAYCALFLLMLTAVLCFLSAGADSCGTCGGLGCESRFHEGKNNNSASQCCFEDIVYANKTCSPTQLAPCLAGPIVLQTCGLNNTGVLSGDGQTCCSSA